ncbi:MAG TPA: hypothetical protein ENJ90_08520 [Devosia sp.]|nr:hypothetical protein [Devosia sp.]
MKRRGKSSSNIHESFSDVALLMLATFVFLLVTVLISSRLAEENEIPRLKKQIEVLQEQLKLAQEDKDRILQHMQKVLTADMEDQVETILESARVGRKDFDLFVQGLEKIPGKTIHLVVDATGSMHGVSTFLVPILRLVIIRSGKELSAITWFSNRTAQTYIGTMAEMFDNLMSGAPFVGDTENIGRAFRAAARDAPPPGAYMLVGDEPSDDTIFYSNIPSPVFTMPLGRSDPGTLREYEVLSQKTGGLTLNLDFK